MDSLLTETIQRIPDYIQSPFWREKGVKIFVYGTGTVARDVYRVLTSHGLMISGFMDHRPREIPLLDQVPVFQPDDPQLSTETRDRARIILAIHNREVNMPPLLEKLFQLGYHNIFSMVDIYDFFSTELGIRYWLTARIYYQTMETILESAYQIFADRLSRDLFSAILRFRITGDFSILPPPDTGCQYFPKDIPAWEAPLRLVDCGAFDGDTLASFLQAGIPIEAAVVFEPDPKNFSGLARSVSGSLADVKEIALWPCGVYSTTTRLQFESEKGEAGILTGSGDITIQCVALDDVIPRFAPTLIKMDIEGAECDALLGAQSILAKFHPGLAIATYHAPAHLWQIPLLVNQIAQANHIKYNYYLRSHAYNSFETIFYAVPSSSGSSS